MPELGPSHDQPGKDWVAWHRGYEDPSSSVSKRLERIIHHLAQALDGARPGHIQLVSLCAGQGHDVLGTLPGHPRRADVSALLVEGNAANAALARERAAASGLTQVRVLEADAGLVASFADALPADVLLLSGIFGNVCEADIKRTVDAASALCSEGARVIWSRHRRPPDMTVRMRDWFAANGFDEVAFDAIDTDILPGVGVHRLTRSPARTVPYPKGPLFSFGSNRR
jgi:hypothetical protein